MKSHFAPSERHACLNEIKYGKHETSFSMQPRAGRSTAPQDQSRIAHATIVFELIRYESNFGQH